MGEPPSSGPDGTRHGTEKALLRDVLEYPLFEALFGRRSRRFGLGMTIPKGPLAFESTAEPIPLTDLEQSLLIAAGVGITGWHFGIPFNADEPGLATGTVRFTGRPTPTAAGIGTPELFYTDDDGVYFVGTRDVEPSPGGPETGVDAVETLLDTVRTHRVQLTDHRLAIPRERPHMISNNFWNANVEGSTVFFPVADVAQQALGILTIPALSGMALYDDQAGCFAGDLDPYFERGLFDRDRPLPLTLLEQIAYSTNATEVGILGHNIVLALQVIGLGGWMFTGMNPLSVMGAFADDGVPGLGFHCKTDERWTFPNPVGLAGTYEGFTPPFYSDMREAVEALVETKFGDGGSFDPASAGPYGSEVTAQAERYPDEFVEALGEMAQYVYDTYGRFPATVPTIYMRPLVQAHHLDMAYYDEHIETSSYLRSHQVHMEKWHGR